jgi:serine/threonine-protein kinase
MTPTDPDRWRRLDAIFDELLQLEPGQRAARLDELTAGEPDLRAEVEDLLRRDLADSTLLDSEAATRFGHLLEDAARQAPAPADLAGTEIGPYRIIERLGEGGMGVVFTARQAHPDRLVALKVLRAGIYAGTHQLRLFQREAESLGRLNHPGIAAIHDAGRTPEGLHWFAMERVEGQTLDAWARGRPSLDSRAEAEARVAVCLAICDAIAHAHQRGVVHLDLKPSNVMVLPPAKPGAAPTVKVLDFGIARLTGGEAGLTTIGSHGAGFVGTLAYMSPEQADGDPRDLDLRSDVYSLGVLFHEVLTGRVPIAIRGASLTEAARLVRTQEPSRPSLACRALRGDLETILLKALEKEPARRYQSVAELGDDLRRWEQDLPIIGRPPSTAYQLRKIVARHRAALGFATALLLALLVAIGGTTWGLLRARSAEAEARAEAKTAAETARFLESVFRVSDPGSGRGGEVTARELLQNAVAGIDTSLADQPEVRGRLLGVMGTAYRQLGLYRDARPLLEQAVALDRQTLGPDDPRVARGHYTLAGLLRRLGEFDAARGHYQEALAIRERLGEPVDLAASLSGLANLEYDRNRLPEAAALYRRALLLAVATAAGDSSRYVSPLSGLGLVHWRLGEADSACAVFERVVEIQRRTLAPDDLDLAWSLSTLSRLYMDIDRARARAPAAEALAVQERALGPDHTDVAETLDVLANLHRMDGEHEAALAMHARALGIWEKAIGTDNATYAMALDHYSRDLAEVGRLDEAIAAAERVEAIFVATLDPEHPAFISSRTRLGGFYRDAGRPGRARELLGDAMKRCEAHYGPGSGESVQIEIELARLDTVEGAWPSAAARYERALAQGAALPDTATVLPRLRAEIAEFRARVGGS